MTKLKNKEVINIWNSLQKLKFEGGKPPKYAYWEARAIRKLGNIAKDLQKAYVLGDEWTDTFEKRKKDLKELLDKCGKRNDKGNLIPTETGGFLLDDVDGYQKGVEVLKETYKDLYDEEDNLNKQYDTLLDEEVDVDVHPIKISMMPSGNIITAEALHNDLFLLVEDDTDDAG